MGIKTWWDDNLMGPWTEHRLMSRKFWIVVVFCCAAIGLDVAGRPLGEPTLGAVRDVVLAFVGVQGFVDMLRYRVAKGRRNGEAE